MCRGSWMAVFCAVRIDCWIRQFGIWCSTGRRRGSGFDQRGGLRSVPTGRHLMWAGTTRRRFPMTSAASRPDLDLEQDWVR